MFFPENAMMIIVSEACNGPVVHFTKHHRTKHMPYRRKENRAYIFKCEQKRPACKLRKHKSLSITKFHVSNKRHDANSKRGSLFV